MAVPKTAELLREINLYLGESEQIIFIYGMDREKVAAGLAASHESVLPFLSDQDNTQESTEDKNTDQNNRGMQFGYRYLEKFVQVPLRIPKPRSDSVIHLLDQETEAESPVKSIQSLESLVDHSLKPLDSGTEGWRNLMSVIASLLEDNPRKIKTFGNLYRLYGFLAIQEGMFDAKSPVTSEQLAKYIALTIQHSQLITKFRKNPELVIEFNKYVLGELERGEVDPRCRPWIFQKSVEELFECGLNGDRNTNLLTVDTLRHLSRVASVVDSGENTSDTTTDKKPSREKTNKHTEEYYGVVHENEFEIMGSIKSQKKIENEFDVSPGITAYAKSRGQNEDVIDNREYHAHQKISDEYYPVTDGTGIQRYLLTWEGEEWLRYGDWLADPRRKEYFTKPRVVVGRLSSAKGGNITAAYSDEEIIIDRNGIVLLPDDNSANKAKALTAILNSAIADFYIRIQKITSNNTTRPQISIKDCKEFPLPGEFVDQDLIDCVDRVRSLRSKRNDLDISLLSYLRNYREGHKLSEVNNYTVSAEADSKLHSTEQQFDSLRIGQVEVKRSGSVLSIYLSARYKPDKDTVLQTDQWGYTETDLLPAVEFQNLNELQAILIEEFVPLAVDESGGFANFRETATKTNSLVDRLEMLRLPKMKDVQEGLEAFSQAKKRKGELDAEIQDVEDEIDTLVYDLYGLSDEEAMIVKSGVPAQS
jgi:hypothetical protein